MCRLPSTRYWLILAALVVAVFLWVGGGAKGNHRPSLAMRGARSADAQIPPKSAPIIDRHGLSRVLAEHPDQLIMLELWVASSVECVDGLNDLIEVQRYFADRDFLVICVNMGEHDRWGQVRRLLIEKGVNFPCHTTDFDGMLGVSEMMGTPFGGEVPFRALFRNGRMINHSDLVADRDQITKLISQQLPSPRG